MFRQREVTLNVKFRTCRLSDLENLEWFGMFYNHRNIIRESFRRHREGNNYMIVAEMNSFPIAQVWIDLEKKRLANTGIIWALRVLPPLQRLGIGTDLIRISENFLQRKGYSICEICVDKVNTSARRLYERLGYSVISELKEEYSYLTPSNEKVLCISEEWMLQKALMEETKKNVSRAGLLV
ncbi:MAG TPA: GNAT family N-acetyltransferase [Ignavibacteriales bacterium]|nr:GNAT family N-acetyltransferase [Ignavibacteriales bacterium]